MLSQFSFKFILCLSVVVCLLVCLFTFFFLALAEKSRSIDETQNSGPTTPSCKMTTQKPSRPQKSRVGESEFVPLENGFQATNYHLKFILTIRWTACSLFNSLENFNILHQIGDATLLFYLSLCYRQTQKVTGLLFKHITWFIICSHGINAETYRDSLCKQGLFRFQSQQKTPTSQLYHIVSQHDESRLAPAMENKGILHVTKLRLCLYWDCFHLD